MIVTISKPEGVSEAAALEEPRHGLPLLRRVARLLGVRGVVAPEVELPNNNITTTTTIIILMQTIITHNSHNTRE